MTNFEKAIRNLNKVMDCYRDEKNISGAVPMPLSTVKESLEALVMKEELLSFFDGFEINEARSQRRLDHCFDMVFPSCQTYPDIEVIKLVFNIANFLLTRYYLTCSKRHHNGHS